MLLCKVDRELAVLISFYISEFGMIIVIILFIKNITGQITRKTVHLTLHFKLL